MDDLRIGPLDSFVDTQSGQTKGGLKKRSGNRQVAPQQEPVDQVTLSSSDETEGQLPGYSPASSHEESG